MLSSISGETGNGSIMRISNCSASSPYSIGVSLIGLAIVLSLSVFGIHSFQAAHGTTNAISSVRSKCLLFIVLKF